MTNLEKGNQKLKMFEFPSEKSVSPFYHFIAQQPEYNTGPKAQKAAVRAAELGAKQQQYMQPNMYMDICIYVYPSTSYIHIFLYKHNIKIHNQKW